MNFGIHDRPPDGWKTLSMGAIRISYHAKTGKTHVSINDGKWIYSSGCARSALLAVATKASGYPCELGEALHRSSPATGKMMPESTAIESEHVRAVLSAERGQMTGREELGNGWTRKDLEPEGNDR